MLYFKKSLRGEHLLAVKFKSHLFFMNLLQAINFFLRTYFKGH